MCNEAVQLVDRVLPNVPIRQWVLSLPWELRGLAATKPKVLGVMDKIFAQEIARAAKRLAAIAGAETGSIGCPQLFGGSLNVHPHLHTLCADGVFERTGDGSVRFHEAPAPSKDDVGEVARRVRDRACRWLRRKGYIDERAAEDRSNETPEPSAIEACTQLALAGGAFLARPGEHPRRWPVTGRSCCSGWRRTISRITDRRETTWQKSKSPLPRTGLTRS